MNVSSPGPTQHKNLLPKDGHVIYHGQVLPPEKASQYFNLLLETIPWKQDEVIMFGKRIVTKRKTAWYGDENYTYTYSRTSRTALPWTTELLELRNLVQGITGETFNSCLLNLYHSGEEGMGWHSDNEKPLGNNPVIASLSLGAERKFSLKHKSSKETISIMLENGSLLEMKGCTQENWLHSLPKTKKVQQPRINLTFRKMYT